MKNSFIPRIVLLAGACALATSLLVAGHDEEEVDPRFNEIDANGDGHISRTESAAEARREFARIDANRDGAVTAAELDAHEAQRREAVVRFTATAPAGTSERNPGSGAARADGSVLPGEVANAHGAASNQASSADHIRQIDRNGDGRISAEEYEAGAAARFGRLDADRDGLLSRSECAADPQAAARKL